MLEKAVRGRRTNKVIVKSGFILPKKRVILRCKISSLTWDPLLEFGEKQFRNESVKIY